MKSLIQKYFLPTLISAAILAIFGLLIYNGQNTNRCEAQNPIWNQASQLIDDRLHTTLKATNPITLIAALAVAYASNPDGTQTFNEIIQCWVKQGGNINQVFKASEAYPLFLEPEVYGQIDQELKNRPTTIAASFAGLSTIVATLLKNGAQPIVGQVSALEAWAEQYPLLEKQGNADQQTPGISDELHRMLNDALQFLLKACDQTQRDAFFEKYPQFKKVDVGT